MTRTRVLLADDHPLTLEGLRAVLEPFYECVETVTNGRALIQAAMRLKPDLIILDISMPLLNGIDAASQIRKKLPEVKLLFATMHATAAYLEAALNAGATGYVVKTDAGKELLEAAETVLNGGVYITPSLRQEVAEGFETGRGTAQEMRLSSREREILQLIAEGRAAKEIAYFLRISIKTVAFHRDNIKRKAGLRTTAELTRHAIEKGLV